MFVVGKIDGVFGWVETRWFLVRPSMKMKVMKNQSGRVSIS